MSTAVLVQRSASHSSPLPARDPERRPSRLSTKAYAPILPARSFSDSYPIMSLSTPSNNNQTPPSQASPRSPNEDERAALQIQQLSASASQTYERQRSPESSRSSQAQSGQSDANSSQLPIIKKEQPPSPELSQPRPARTPSSSRQHRPRRLDLSKEMPSSQSGRPSAPLTAKESAGLVAMHDVAQACLSPGFQTQDPEKQEQLARSMDLREQQRQIIEARLNKTAGKDVDLKAATDGPASSSFSKPLGTGTRRKGPPPGLSITAPAAHHFASEPRVVHSAPINVSFTGLKPAPAHLHPLSRQVLEHSHHHHHHLHSSASDPNAAPQFGPLSNNPPSSSHRLPPIQDVFNSANEAMASNQSNYQQRDSLSRENSRTLYAPHNNNHLGAPTHSPRSSHYPAALHSPGHPPTSAKLQPPNLGRSSSSNHSREFRSSEDAVQTLSGGREELRPKIVHYGGPHQPPTPPSPHQNIQPQASAGAGGLGPYSQSQSFPQTQHQQQHQQQQQVSSNGSSFSQYSQGAPPAQYGPINTSVSSTRPDVASGKRRSREDYERDYADAERMEIDGERDRVRVKSRNGEWRDQAGAGDAGDALVAGGGLGLGVGMAGVPVREQRLRDMDVSRDREREVEREREREREHRRKEEKREEFLSLCARAWDLLHEP